MASLYKTPDEIDLFLAGMAEKVEPSSGILGPTFLHIVADQFARLKEADRYFYENGGQSGSFTSGMLFLRFDFSFFPFDRLYSLPLNFNRPT